jgi:hypothetical protein
MALNFPNAPDNGDTYEGYVWNDTVGAWQSTSINDLDFIITLPTTGQIIEYNGTDWVNGQIDTNGIADTAITTGKLPAGTILQVVQAEKTDTQTGTITGNGGTAAITGLTATITPRATSSKILVMYDLSVSDSQQRLSATLLRGATAIGVGAAAGSRSRVTGGYGQANASDTAGQLHGQVLDSPATTSAINYTMQLNNHQGSSADYYVNRGSTDSDNVRYPRMASRITLMEVAG